VNLGNINTLGITATDRITASASDANGNTSEFTPLFAQTAAGVTVSGRVLAHDGRGVRQATVTLTAQNGAQKVVRTGSRGNFLFEDVEAGATYIISVSSRRYNFAPRAIQVNDNLADVNLIATER
jgi:hypothetical protein